MKFVVLILLLLPLTDSFTLYFPKYKSSSLPTKECSLKRYGLLYRCCIEDYANIVYGRPIKYRCRVILPL